MTSSPTSEEVDSTSSSSSTTANDLDNFVVPGSGGSKIYPYLPPRIDEDKYQVNIPQLTTRKPGMFYHLFLFNLFIFSFSFYIFNISYITTYHYFTSFSPLPLNQI